MQQYPAHRALCYFGQLLIFATKHNLLLVHLLIVLPLYYASLILGRSESNAHNIESHSDR